MTTILFLCVANSARSQIAEGLAKKMFGDKVNVMSAGSNPAESVQPMAIEVLKEIGIDISANTPKSYKRLPIGFIASMQYTITLCEEEACPNLVSKAKRLTWALPDPAAASEAEKLAAFRKARDEIESRLKVFGQEIGLL